MDSLILKSLYGTDDPKEIVTKKTTGKQIKAQAGDVETATLTPAECMDMCKQAGLKYEQGYENRVRTYTITADSVDRYGDIVRSAGLDITNYLKNPVVQFAHDYSRLPVGNSIKIWKGAGFTKAMALFFDDRVDTSGFADMIFRFVNANALRACSIGFGPKSYNTPTDPEERAKLGLGPWGVEYTKSELLEFSAVPVPAHPDALSEEYRLNFRKSLASGLFTARDVTLLRANPILNTQMIDEFIRELGQNFVGGKGKAEGNEGDDNSTDPDDEWDGTFTESMCCAIGKPDKDGTLKCVKGIHGDNEDPALEFSYKGKSGKADFSVVNHKDAGEYGIWSKNKKHDSHTDLKKIPAKITKLLGGDLLVSDEKSITCSVCNKSVDYNAQPEVAMGSIMCPHCNSIIDQTGKSFKVRGVIPYAEHSKDPEDTPWDGPAEKAKAEPKDLKVMCAWFESDKPDIKGSYKLPHHRAEGYHTNWGGVKAAMSALLGGRGGLDVPDGDRKGIYEHLSKHYKDFGKDAPEFKDLSGDDVVLQKMDVLIDKIDSLVEEIKQKSPVKPKEKSISIEDLVSCTKLDF